MGSPVFRSKLKAGTRNRPEARNPNPRPEPNQAGKKIEGKKMTADTFGIVQVNA
jgi:hypothetical protein